MHSPIRLSWMDSLTHMDGVRAEGEVKVFLGNSWVRL